MANRYAQPPPMNGAPRYQRPTVQGPKTLHIYSNGAFSKGFRIMDSDKTTSLYNVELHTWSKPHIRIIPAFPRQGGTNEIGSASFRNFSSSVDMNVRGQPMVFERSGAFSSGYQWRSPALGGRLLTWKVDGMLTANKHCYVDNDKRNIVARWEQPSMSVKKAGKIHILDPNLAIPGTPGFDELVVSAVVQMQIASRNRNNSSGGGASIDVSVG